MGGLAAAQVGLVAGALAFPEEAVAQFGAGLHQAAADFLREARIVEADGEIFRAFLGGFLPGRADFGGEVVPDVEDPEVGRFVAFLLAGSKVIFALSVSVSMLPA